MNNGLFRADELAEELDKGRSYVYAMKAAGFVMPGGTATLEEARAWLRDNPNFSSTGYFKKNEPKPKGAVGRKRGIDLKNIPEGYNDRAVYFSMGHLGSSDTAVVHQVLIDFEQIPKKDAELNMDGELEDGIFSDNKVQVGELFFDKLRTHDVDFFKSVAEVVKWFDEGSQPVARLESELLRVKFCAARDGITYDLSGVLDQLPGDCRKSDDKTVRAACLRVGLVLKKGKRGRPKG